MSKVVAGMLQNMESHLYMYKNKHICKDLSSTSSDIQSTEVDATPRHEQV